MKFLLGVISGTLVTLGALYGTLTYYFSDYIVSEKILSSPELQNSIATLGSLQEKLRKIPEIEDVPFCTVICKPSPYLNNQGSREVNKVKALDADLQNRGRKVADDPGFLLDMYYVQKAMLPIQDSGFFNWLKSVPAEKSDLWQDQAGLSSQLAMTAPRLVLALQQVQIHLQVIGQLRTLRQECKPKNHEEIQEKCNQALLTLK